MQPTNIAQLMVRDVVTVTPADTLHDAIDLFRRRKIRHLPVVEGGVLVGILTDRDVKKATPSLLTAGLERSEYERVLTQTTVGQVMTRDPLTIAPSDSIRSAVDLLVTRKVGSLPVVAEGKLVGIVTDHDFLRLFAELLASGKM